MCLNEKTSALSVASVTTSKDEMHDYFSQEDIARLKWEAVTAMFTGNYAENWSKKEKQEILLFMKLIGNNAK